MSASPHSTFHSPALANSKDSVSGPGETGTLFPANADYGAEEYYTHPNYTKIGCSKIELVDAVNDSASRTLYAAGRGSSKKRHISCSSTSDPSKRLKPLDFLQPRSVSFQERSKATRTASADVITREENWSGQSTMENVSNSTIEFSNRVQPPPHYWSGFVGDIVSSAVTQHQLVCLETFTRMKEETTYVAQPASCQHAAMGNECHNLQGSVRPLAAQSPSMSVTYATGSENSSQRGSATTEAQQSTTGHGFSARSGYPLNAQTAGPGSGDGGDDPGEHNKPFKPLRGHEIDTADGGRKLLLNVCAKFHQHVHLQHSEDPESSREEDQDTPSYGRGRSYSCSNNTNQSFTGGLAQRSESAPAQTQCPHGNNRDGTNPDDDTTFRPDDQDLRQALILRSRMVRASDITGEPTVDAPWVHHMRPSSLLELRRGAEGYGGYGGLANLPDADTSSRVENERIAPETLLDGLEPNGMSHQTATNRDSFSFISSVSSNSQHVALADQPVQERDDGGPSHDQYSIISQHRALVDGPPEELLYTYALQDRGLIEAFFPPTTADTETSEHVECSEPRRRSVPHMTPQALTDSSSAEDLSIHGKSQTRSVPHGIRERCRERRRQGSSWSTVLCCLGTTEHDRQSSPENERSSSETARSKNSASQTDNQDLRTSGSHAEGH